MRRHSLASSPPTHARKTKCRDCRDAERDAPGGRLRHSVDEAQRRGRSCAVAPSSTPSRNFISCSPTASKHSFRARGHGVSENNGTLKKARVIELGHRAISTQTGRTKLLKSLKRFASERRQRPLCRLPPHRRCPVRSPQDRGESSSTSTFSARRRSCLLRLPSEVDVTGNTQRGASTARDPTKKCPTATERLKFPRNLGPDQKFPSNLLKLRRFHNVIFPN